MSAEYLGSRIRAYAQRYTIRLTLGCQQRLDDRNGLPLPILRQDTLMGPSAVHATDSTEAAFRLIDKKSDESQDEVN